MYLYKTIYVFNPVLSLKLYNYHLILNTEYLIVFVANAVNLLKIINALINVQQDIYLMKLEKGALNVMDKP